jgi:hypothetical protein
MSRVGKRYSLVKHAAKRPGREESCFYCLRSSLIFGKSFVIINKEFNKSSFAAKKPIRSVPRRVKKRGCSIYSKPKHVFIIKTPVPAAWETQIPSIYSTVSFVAVAEAKRALAKLRSFLTPFALAVSWQDFPSHRSSLPGFQ